MIKKKNQNQILNFRPSNHLNLSDLKNDCTKNIYPFKLLKCVPNFVECGKDFV